MPPVFRFAPSPNGYLHLGHALSALLNADTARAKAGQLLLRIEDIDAARCRPEYETAIYEDLRWLGLRWETPVRRQSEHWDDQMFEPVESMVFLEGHHRYPACNHIEQECPEIADQRHDEQRVG